MQDRSWPDEPEPAPQPGRQQDGSWQTTARPRGDRPGHPPPHRQESESTMTWDFMWTTFTVYVFVAFMFMLILVLRDLFRSDSSGLVKAIWVVALVFLPIVTS